MAAAATPAAMAPPTTAAMTKTGHLELSATRSAGTGRGPHTSRQAARLKPVAGGWLPAMRARPGLLHVKRLPRLSLWEVGHQQSALPSATLAGWCHPLDGCLPCLLARPCRLHAKQALCLKSVAGRQRLWSRSKVLLLCRVLLTSLLKCQCSSCVQTPRPSLCLLSTAGQV